MELLGRAAHPAWLVDLGLPPGHARPSRRGACHLVFLSTQKISRSLYFFKAEKPHLPVYLATPGARPGSNGETMEKAADFVRGQPGLHQPCRGLRCHGQLATWDGSVNPGLAPLCQQETRGLRSRDKKWVGGGSPLSCTQVGTKGGLNYVSPNLPPSQAVLASPWAHLALLVGEQCQGCDLTLPCMNQAVKGRALLQSPLWTDPLISPHWRGFSRSLRSTAPLQAEGVKMVVGGVGAPEVLGWRAGGGGDGEKPAIDSDWLPRSLHGDAGDRGWGAW